MVSRQRPGPLARAGSLSRTGSLTRRTVLAAGLLMPLAAHATPAHRRPMLTVHYPTGDALTFDEAGLRAMPWTVFTTHTQWTQGPQTFAGPLLSDVLTANGTPREEIEPRELLLQALNEFRVTAPATDAWTFGPILAREMNGSPMRVRDKGPLWLVYPRDSHPQLKAMLIEERWIWQLSTITIR